MLRRMRTIVVLAACSLVATGLAAGSAAAGRVDTVGTVRYVRHGFQIEAGQAYVAIKAMCPRRTHVTGGGVSNDADFGELSVVHTYPVDGHDRGSAPDDGWAVLLQNRDEDGHRGKVYAICTEHSVRYITQSFQVASGVQEDFDVSCPQDTFVLSGGTRGPRQVIENSTFPVDNVGWGGYVENLSVVEKTFKQTAVCSEIATTVEQSNGDEVGPLSTDTRSATCPDALVVYGGGHDNGAGFGGLYASALFPAGADHDVWRIAVDNFSDSFSFTTGAYAVCGASD